MTYYVGRRRRTDESNANNPEPVQIKQARAGKKMRPFMGQYIQYTVEFIPAQVAVFFKF